MKKSIAALIVVVALPVLAGCESRGGSALLGGIGGAAAGAGGYEYHLNQQKKRVQEAYDAGQMNQQEYDIRMDQIRRDSLIQ